MQLSAHLPPLLVVGVGYRAGGIDETIILRARDFTPTFDPRFQGWFPEHTLMGGADRFLAFFRDELQPWVRSRYRVDANDAAYFGHSLGGLFGTYVLLTAAGHVHPLRDRQPVTVVARRHDLRLRSAVRRDAPRPAGEGVLRRRRPRGPRRPSARGESPPRRGAVQGRVCATSTWSPTPNAWSRRCAAGEYPSLEIDSIVLPDEFHITVQHVNLSRRAPLPLRRPPLSASNTELA